MSRKRCLSSLLATFVVALFFGLPARAGVDPTPFRTGFFGVMPGQTVRVSLLNAAGEPDASTPCVSPEPLVAKIAIRELAGSAMFEGISGKLLPGAGAFVDYTPPAKALTSGVILQPVSAVARRVQMRAEVTFSEEDLVRVQCSGVALTLEVIDAGTGRTEFTMPFAAVMFNPQPEPPEPIRVAGS